MNRKIILLLLLGHTLFAHATPNAPLSLKLESELSDTKSPSDIIYHNDKYDYTNKITLSTHPEKTSLRLKLSSEGIDESRIGKITDKERTALLKRQRQIYPNKHISSFNIAEKKDESSKTASGTNRLQHFAWHPAESTPSNPPIVDTSIIKISGENSNNSNKIIDNPANKTEKTEWHQTELTWQIGGVMSLGLVLFYLARKTGLRYPFKLKIRVQHTVSINKIKESLLLPSARIALVSKDESPVEDEVSLNTQISHLSIDPDLIMDESCATSTCLDISPVSIKPIEQPSDPTDQIEISPVVLPMISAIRSLAPSPLASVQSETVVEVELPDTVNFFADFNPSKYVNPTEFLESRRSLTIEQIIEWSKCVSGAQQFIPMAHKFG